MQKIICLFILLNVITGCSSPTGGHYNESRELVPNPEGYKKDTFIAPASAAKIDTPAKQGNTYFPFELREGDGRYQVVANLESAALYPGYYQFFEKHGYEGNGPCWEGHIVQILEKLDKDLLQHIDFNVEAGGFYASADSKENQTRFVTLLSPIFSDLKKLDEWVSKADRSRVDD
ncbi:MAG: hypothetical protein EON98_07245 [Chitinophagaceae bacterium]|nr:MAG: hypothetical protein EON98_07245 [Chitinophagaceae bacterium]